MNTDFREIIAGIQKIKMKVPDIYHTPKRMLAYLFDWFPEREEMLVKMAPVILSDISVLFYEQLQCGGLNSRAIISEIIKNEGIEAENANEYLELLFEAEGVRDHFEQYLPQEENKFKENKFEPEYPDLSKLSGDISAKEYYRMACLQKTEKGIQNISRYTELLEKASEKGHLTAKHSIALLYLKGKYVSQDLEKGFSLLRECAEQGHENSNYEIYVFSKRYKNVINESTAFDYLKRASEAGITQAEYDLAMLYYENGTEADYKKAFDLWSKCADKNDAGALYQLALCYRYGRGTAFNIQSAMEMLKRAANLGHKRAREIVGG